MAVTAGCCSGGDSFTCDQLGGCSITDLGDVDTTTTPPSPGGTLVWDGAQWVPGPPAGPESLTTGCGLSGEGTDTSPLVVATSGQWGESALPYACPDTAGQPVYCDSNGQLRTVPARFQDALQETIALDSGKLPDFAPPGPAVDLESLSGTFTNPSECLPFIGMVQVAIDHAEFIFRSGDINVTLLSGLDISGDANIFKRVHQHWYFLDSQDHHPYWDTTAMKLAPITIPPGGTITYTLTGSMALGFYSGTNPDAELNGASFQFNLWGGN